METRDNHNKMYEINPEFREKRLSDIKKKYAAKIKIKESDPNFIFLIILIALFSKFTYF